VRAEYPACGEGVEGALWRAVCAPIGYGWGGGGVGALDSSHEEG
jgi:hypothetical protein